MPGSRAEENGGIRPGDRILEVNGKDLRDSTVDDAAAFMMVGDVIIMSWVDLRMIYSAGIFSSFEICTIV